MENEQPSVDWQGDRAIHTVSISVPPGWSYDLREGDETVAEDYYNHHISESERYLELTLYCPADDE